MKASFFFGSVLATSVLFGSGVAHAAGVVSGGVSVLLGGGIVGLLKPGDTTVQVGDQTGRDNTYPGFFGGTFGRRVARRSGSPRLWALPDALSIRQS